MPALSSSRIALVFGVLTAFAMAHPFPRRATQGLSIGPIPPHMPSRHTEAPPNQKESVARRYYNVSLLRVELRLTLTVTLEQRRQELARVALRTCRDLLGRA